VEVQSVRATVDTTEIGIVNPNARAVVALNADSELLPVARSNGVLAALAVPSGGSFGAIAGTPALIQLDGWIQGREVDADNRQQRLEQKYRQRAAAVGTFPIR